MINPELKVGDRVILLHMEDEYSNVPPTTEGVVTNVNDVMGETIYSVKWDNGSSLNLISTTDLWKKKNEDLKESFNNAEWKRTEELIKNIDVPSIQNIGDGLGQAAQNLASSQGFTNGFTTVSAKYGFSFDLTHINTGEVFTFEYNDGPTYYYTSILPTETQWTNTINQGLIYFANSGINTEAGVQIIYDSNTEQLQVVSVVCGFDDVVISEISVLYDIQIQG